jgi:hypothetical protein
MFEAFGLRWGVPRDAPSKDPTRSVPPRTVCFVTWDLRYSSIWAAEAD